MREAFVAMQARITGPEAQAERQDYLIAGLRHTLYGKRSGQLAPDERQLAFEDPETAVAEAEAAREALAAPQGRCQGQMSGSQRNPGDLPEHLPRIEQVIEPAQKICSCGCTDMVKIGEDRAERPDIVPPRFQVIVTVRPRYACRRCDRGVMQADPPNWLIEGGLLTEGTLARVAVSKYAGHLPLYRQCQICGRGGVGLGRSPLANWWGVAAYHLAPVVDRMLVHLKRSGRLFMDETRAPVRDPRAGKTRTGSLWALTRDGEPLWRHGFKPNGERVGRRRSARRRLHLCARASWPPCDGHPDGLRGPPAGRRLHRPGRPGRAKARGRHAPRRWLDAGLLLACCRAHSRRKLHDICQKDGSGIAAEGLRRVARIDKIEASVRGRPPEERLAARQAQSAPLIADFRLWLTQQRSRISAKSRLGEKLSSLHRHWDGLPIFLTDGRVEMDTNPVTNTISPITLNRKNALFTGHDEGGRTWARMASLIETCKMNAVAPYARLRETLTTIPNGHPA